MAAATSCARSHTHTHPHAHDTHKPIANFRNGNGCNTVVYCKNEAGCGSGCSADVFGPFYGNKPKCVDGKFPYQMCSLKWNDDINAPIIYEENSADWLSMTTSKGFPRM